MKKFDQGSRKSFAYNKDFKARKFKRTEKTEAVQGTAVVLKEGESVESLIRRFKKIVELAGILKELKKREHYLGPSQKKREKQKRAQKRARKDLKNSQVYEG